MYQTLKYEVKENIGYVTVSRPEALNALNKTVLEELYAVFTEISADDAVRAVIVTGEGRSFVAGADIAQMSKLETIEGRAFGIFGQKVMHTIESMEKPVIAAVNGFALGGGCELSMACDIRVASTKAKFGQPEVKLGILPGFGGTQRLSKLVGKGMAKMLIMTADMIDAAEAHRIGLVDKVVEPEALMEECEAIAKRIAANSPLAVAMSKTVVNAGFALDIHSGCSLEAEAFGSCFGTADQKEGMAAFLEKRPPVFQNK
ncbi:MAG: enoyl-CoA hydratase/isomerase family protein [Firmicutes bacterium]|nr:enoyl-CoA hydratase/isomerase family protein [Bacillota bacterium]